MVVTLSEPTGFNLEAPQCQSVIFSLLLKSVFFFFFLTTTLRDTGTETTSWIRPQFQGIVTPACAVFQPSLTILFKPVTPKCCRKSSRLTSESVKGLPPRSQSIPVFGCDFHLLWRCDKCQAGLRGLKDGHSGIVNPACLQRIQGLLISLPRAR